LILTKKGYFKLQDCISKQLAIKTIDGFEKIKTFKSIGEHHVYDIEIDSEFHNFYANQIVVHNCVYSYVTYLTLFFKVYYPSYFYAGMINNDSDITKIQAIIADAKDYPIAVLPHSIIKSTYQTKVESDTSIRLGYGMIKGLGTAVEEELMELKLHECKTLGEVLQKPFKKINATQFENLIDLGAFDEFNIDRGVIRLLHSLYADPKIEQWFTRKTQAVRLETIPKVLKDNFDSMECLKIAIRIKSEPEPWKLLLSELIQKVKLEPLEPKKYFKETVKKQKELLGFSMGTETKIAEVASSFKAIGVAPLSEFTSEHKDYYFIIEKAIKATTKTGKQFLQLVLNDGKQTIKAKCWKALEVKEDEVYRGRFKKDDYGFTLLGDKNFIKI
jgi:DNA polymerase III alpha subunit